jgi:hypothetical protein
MTKGLDRLAGIRSATVDEVLSALGEHGAGQTVLVTLHLLSGRDLIGWVRGSEATSRQRRHLLLHRAGSDRGMSDDVAYIDPARIEAVTVHQASRHIPLLSFGTADPAFDEAPTKLALQRRAHQIGVELGTRVGATLTVEVDWSSISDEDRARYALGEVLEEIARAFEAIIEEHGPQPIAAQLDELAVEHGGSPSVSRDARRLRVVAELMGGSRGRLTGPHLRRALEAVL